MEPYPDTLHNSPLLLFDTGSEPDNDELDVMRGGGWKEQGEAPGGEPHRVCSAIKSTQLNSIWQTGADLK